MQIDQLQQTTDKPGTTSQKEERQRERSVEFNHELIFGQTKPRGSAEFYFFDEIPIHLGASESILCI